MKIGVKKSKTKKYLTEEVMKKGTFVGFARVKYLTLALSIRFEPTLTLTSQKTPTHTHSRTPHRHRYLVKARQRRFYFNPPPPPLFNFPLFFFVHIFTHRIFIFIFFFLLPDRCSSAKLYITGKMWLARESLLNLSAIIVYVDCISSRLKRCYRIIDNNFSTYIHEKT